MSKPVSSSSEWKSFTARAVQVLRMVDDDQLSSEAAYDFFDQAPELSNPEVRDYLSGMIWERFGFPEFWADLPKELEQSTSEADFLRRIDRPS